MDKRHIMADAAEKLLLSGEVGYVIGWGATRFEDRTTPLFITKPEDAGKLVWNEHCVCGLAKYALDDPYPEKKIGIFVRGCDSRAVNRLLADGSLKREKLYLIGVPCEGKESEKCSACRHKNPLCYDLLLWEPVPEDASAPRFPGVEALEAKTPEEKLKFWNDVFSKCIRCYACRNVCPACNCRECYVEQEAVGWQGKQVNTGPNRVFGLTRAYHVGDRCIECGECERVCPMDLPLMLQTRKILKDINELFGPYECGLDPEPGHALGDFELGDADDFM